MSSVMLQKQDRPTKQLKRLLQLHLRSNSLGYQFDLIAFLIFIFMHVLLVHFLYIFNPLYERNPLDEGLFVALK